jgi:hypothetical protein
MKVAVQGHEQGQKLLHILVDHINFLKSLRDDVINNGGPPLAHVISPKKVPKRSKTSEVASTSTVTNEADDA